MGLLACGSFLVVAVGAFRREGEHRGLGLDSGDHAGAVDRVPAEHSNHDRCHRRRGDRDEDPGHGQGSARPDRADDEGGAEPAPEAAAAAEPGKAEDTQETQEKTEPTPPSGNTEA